MSVQGQYFIDPTGTLLVAVPVDTVTLIPQAVTAVNSSPTITVNGSGNTLGVAVWTETSNQCCHVSWLLSTPLSGGETVLLTASANFIGTADGNLPAATGATVDNATGLEYPTIGSLPAFNATPKMYVGQQTVQPPAVVNVPWYPLKNWSSRIGKWNVSSGTFFETSDHEPVSWNVTSATISALLLNSADPNEIDSQGTPTQCGVWTVSWIDSNIGTGAELQTWLSSGNSGNNVGTGLDTTSRVNGVRTVLPGNRVVITYPNVQLASGHTTWDLHLTVNHTQSSGQWQGNISGYTVIPPGNTIDFGQFAIDDNFKNMLVSSSGKGPYYLRMMQSSDTIDDGQSNTVDRTDMVQADWFSFRGPSNSGNTGNISLSPTQIRRFNTDVTLSNGPHGNSTYAWPACTGYITNSFGWGTFETDASSPTTYTGLRLSTNISPYSSADNGSTLAQGNPSGSGGNYCVELVFAEPHNLKTGWQLFFPATTATFSVATVGGGPFSINLNNITPFIWVTSPTTIAVSYFFSSITSGTGMAFLNQDTPLVAGTDFTAFTITGSTPLSNPGGGIPVEALASICNQIGANPWINLGFCATPACVASAMTAVQTYCPNASIYNLECSNETWNDMPGKGQAYGMAYTIGQCIAYLPTGTKIGNYYTSTFGTILSRYDTSFLVQNIQTEAAVSVLGRNKVNHSVGSFWATAPLQMPRSQIPFANTWGIPLGSLTFAPYDLPGINGISDSTIVTAFGTWRCATINSWSVLQLTLNAETWAAYEAIQNDSIGGLDQYTGPTEIDGVAVGGQINGKPVAMAYEFAIQYLIMAGVANRTALNIDCTYEPNYAKCVRAMYMQAQNGSPNLANSGFYEATWFNSVDSNTTNGAQWSMARWMGQLPGTGIGMTNTSQSIQAGGSTGNGVSQQFATAQGGSPGNGVSFDRTNDSVGLAEWLAIQDVANPGGVGPAPPGPGAPSVNTLGTVAFGSIAFGGSLGPAYIPSLTIREAVVAWLVSMDTLSSQLARRIYWVDPSQISLYPCLVCEVPTRSYGYNLAGFDGTSDATIKLTAMALTEASCISIAEAVRNVMQGFRGLRSGVAILRCFLDDEADGTTPPPDGSDRWIYNVSLEYRIRHRVPMPTSVTQTAV